MAVLNQLFDFHDRDLTSQTEIALSHDSRIRKSRWHHISWEIQVSVGKFFEQSRLDVCLEMLAKVNHQVAVIVIWHIRQTRAMMERKTRYEVQELLVAEHETDGSTKFITGEDLGTWYRDKIKERYVPRNWNLMKRYKKHSYKVRTGRALMS